MTWFRVDDNFHDHKKIDRLIEETDQWMQAIGLWTLAGAWCSRQLTDGFIPSGRIYRLASGVPRDTCDALVTALCNSGYWHPIAAAPAAARSVTAAAQAAARSVTAAAPAAAFAGFQFHDWDKYQPSAAEVLQHRDRERRKKAAWRERKRLKNKGDLDPDDVSPGVSPVDMSTCPESVPGGQVVDGRPGVHLYPTRPDPTRPPKDNYRAGGEMSTKLSTVDKGVDTKPSKPKQKGGKRPKGYTQQTWEAYATAYTVRYGVPPTRNAQVSGILARFIDRVGINDSAAVAAFYVAHNGDWYVKKGHGVKALLEDAESLHTQWQTNRQTTATQARQADRRQATADSFGPLISEAEKRERLK